MKRLISVLLLIAFSVCFIVSCKKNKGAPPALPPYESMVIDFSNFTSQKKSAQMTFTAKGTETSTWTFAANVAGVWNTLLSSNITVPLAALAPAKNYSPAFVSDNLWEWSYNFTSGQNSYKAKLQGKISTNTVEWTMYITLEGTGGYTDFPWVTGTSKSDGSGGQWIVKESPQSAVSLFQDDWIQSGDEITGVKYTYVKADTNNGSYINYLLLTSGNFDAGFNIHFSDNLYSDTNIEWNIVTHDGRLQSLDYLQDENWYCWDTNKINKICD